ncbi:MAG: hypothetical protein IKH04_06130 [Kiritimatiellae bacterium]|nr:hypothetical protein [Kiritimatiellia bacterium]
MQTPSKQPPSPNPEAPPARRLRRERIVIAVELLFCAVLAIAGAFLLRGPDGSVDPAAFHERMGTGPAWGRGILLAALLLGLAAEFDLLGRFVAVPFARIVRGRYATARQSARLRLAAQVAVVAIVALWMAVKPDAFPHPIGWIRFAVPAAIVFPVILSVVDCRRGCGGR